MEIKTIKYLNETGDLSSSCSQIISNETLIRGYRTLVLNRLVDDRMITLQRQGAITFAMSSRGEEATVIASAAALEAGDWVYPQYRESGVMFWRGWTLQQFVHNMFCNAEDPNKGHQMPNHFGSRDLNVVTVSSVLGTQLPHAAGCAYAMKMQKDPHIALTYFGEGAASEGDFSAALNFAAVRKAPVIFFCRNNGYAISTKTSDQFTGDGIAPRGIGYGVKTCRCDGNDFFAIHDTVSQARQHCLDGKGPVLIEAMTYRLGPHSTSDDPSVYRNDEEVNAWKQKCPILRLRRYLEKQNLWDDSQEQKLHDSIKDELDKAIETAKNTPQPPLRSLIEDVYFEIPHTLREQLLETKNIYSKETEEVMV